MQKINVRPSSCNLRFLLLCKMVILLLFLLSTLFLLVLLFNAKNNNKIVEKMHRPNGRPEMVGTTTTIWTGKGEGKMMAERKLAEENSGNKVIAAPKPTNGQQQEQLVASSMNFTLKFSNLSRKYSMQTPAPEMCRGIDMLVLVMSRRGASGKREGIRQSWAKDARKAVLIRFVIGAPVVNEKNAPALDGQLVDEQKKYADLIFYDMEDGYENLHLKMGAAFQWQQAFCKEAQFVMKTDDDTIVDLGRFEIWKERKFVNDLKKNARAFIGYVLKGKEPFREKGHKWYVSKESFPGDVFPDYMQGATYVATTQAISAIMPHTQEAIGFNMDDILYTGILAAKANVSLFNYGFWYFRGWPFLYPNEPCENGVPRVLSYFLPFDGKRDVQEYRNAYNKLHTLKCN